VRWTRGAGFLAFASPPVREGCSNRGRVDGTDLGRYAMPILDTLLPPKPGTETFSSDCILYLKAESVAIVHLLSVIYIVQPKGTEMVRVRVNIVMLAHFWLKNKEPNLVYPIQLDQNYGRCLRFNERIHQFDIICTVTLDLA